MTLRAPRLDDRDFAQLLAEAERYASAQSGWRPGNPNDPGTILLELFAHLTEVLLYRVNRLPEKIYVELLRLLGVERRPPAAATAELEFTLATPLARAVTVPAHSRVVSADGELEFVTLTDCVLPAGASRATARAVHAEWVGFEVIGRGSGQPGLSLNLGRAPLLAPVPERCDLIVGVEVSADGTGAGQFTFQDKTFETWREVGHFAGLDPGAQCYRADRLAGQILFAPALLHTCGTERPEALAAVVPAGRQVVARYRIGGGAHGNLPPGALVKLLDPPAGVQLSVTNPGRALGGADLEPLANVLARGPLELHSLERAVTAQDFELLASQRVGAVQRAHAYTKRQLWQYAPPGTVEVVLVPEVPAAPEPLSPAALHACESEVALTQIQQLLDQRKPLGTVCRVVWCKYKSVRVRAAVTAHPEQDRGALEQRLRARLNGLITPATGAGWPFGQPLTVYDIYRSLGAEPGIKSVAPVTLCVTEVPGAQVAQVEADAWQPGVWYAAAAGLFRSVNDAAGWELMCRWQGERVVRVRSFPRANRVAAEVAGLLLVLTETEDDNRHHALYLSRDAGESWLKLRNPDYPVNDLAWIEQNGRASILVATEKGLFEQGLDPEREWQSRLLDPAAHGLPVRAVAVATDAAGGNTIAAAGPPDRGVFLAVGDGQPFKAIGLQGKWVAALYVQTLHTQSYLWAAIAAVGDDPGEGAVRWQLQRSGESAESWRRFDQGWAAGGCTALAFHGRRVWAASRRLGVLSLNLDQTAPDWSATAVNCGLPMERLGEFEPVTSLALAGRDDSSLLLAGGPEGIYSSADGGQRFRCVSASEFTDTVTLPPTWLFCSAEHELSVSHEVAPS